MHTIQRTLSPLLGFVVGLVLSTFFRAQARDVVEGKKISGKSSHPEVRLKNRNTFREYADSHLFVG